MLVIVNRGRKNVPKIFPKSREWITILCCVNAIGASIPGFYLFKGKNQLKNYIQNCEPGACMAAHPHAWMTKELFLIGFATFLHLCQVVSHLRIDTYCYLMAMEATWMYKKLRKKTIWALTF